MTILVDDPVWPWRDRLWAHLASDVDLRELHLFAEELSIPRRGFGGDHYDIPADYVAKAVDAGAVAVSGRELVARITAAGLRRRRTAAPVPPKVMLVGLMGAGKTTIGRAVTTRTGWTYVDNDLVLERLAGRPTAELADALGWDGLHDLEIDTLRAVLDSPAPYVAGAAASVVDRVEGRALLREAFVVYLRAEVETLVARVGDGAGRPWLSGDVKGFIEAQTIKRGALFEQVATLVLDVDDNDVNLAAGRIVAGVLAD